MLFPGPVVFLDLSSGVDRMKMFPDPVRVVHARRREFTVLYTYQYHTHTIPDFKEGAAKLSSIT